jgi:hypothetical protein
MSKPYFRNIGFQRDTVSIMFRQNGFNVQFEPQFGDDKPNPEGVNILYSDFDGVRQESKEANPDYEISEHRSLIRLYDKIKERLSCAISRGMRLAYDDVLDEIKEELRRSDE